MATGNFDGAPIRGAHLVAQLKAAGIRLPRAVTDAHRHHLAQRDALAKLPPVHERERRLIAAIEADPTGDHLALAAAVAADEALRRGHNAATDTAGRRLSAVVEACADDITVAIGATLAGPAITALVRAAEATAPTDTLASLTMAGDSAAARLLVDASHAVPQLEQARKLRSAAYHRSGIDKNPHALWQNPEVRPFIEPTADSLERYLAGIRAGAGLTWRTFTEADAAERRARKAVTDNTAPEPAPAA